MKNIIKIFVVFFLFCTQLFATQHQLLDYMGVKTDKEIIVNAHLATLFRSSFGKELDVKKQLVDSINKINKNEIGKGLLDRLVFLIETMKKLQVGDYDGVIHITFKEGEGTYFTGRGYVPSRMSRFGRTSEQPMRVYLNLDFNNKSIIFNLQYGLGTLIPAIKPSPYNSDFCEIVHCFDPFWITIAHELIHMEHFLTEELNKYIKNYIYRTVKYEDVTTYFTIPQNLNFVKENIEKLSEFKGFGIDIFEELPIPENVSIESLQNYYKFLNNPLRFHARYSANKKLCDWDSLSHVISYFPELKARNTGRKSLSFFANLEERETVIGSRCSELMIRIAEGKCDNILPIRYLYQDMDTFFLEKISVILEIINNARKTLKISELTKEDLICKLSHKDLADFFNLGLFSHIITEELMPDLM